MVATSTDSIKVPDKKIVSLETTNIAPRVEGSVLKIWSRIKNGDIMVKLILPDTNSEYQSRITIQISCGQIMDEDISLIEGDLIRVQGYMTYSTNMETTKEFLSRAGKKSILETYPTLDEIASQKVLRPAIYLVPTTLEYLKKNTELKLNNTRIEGVVSRIWSHETSQYATIAVLDNHYHFDQPVDKQKNPHEFVVWFKDGMVGGREINLVPKKSENKGVHVGDRVRVIGHIEEYYTPETLRRFLLRMQKVEVLASIPNANDIGAITATSSQCAIVAEKIIHYTNFKTSGY